jgi:hypothetical protein
MRRVLLTLLVILLVVPAATAAATAAPKAPGDGSLVVRKANGKITIYGRGTILGRLDRGSLYVVDYKPDDSVEPQVTGAEQTMLDGIDGKWLYRGDNIRFRFFGGRYKLVLTSATGVDISAVGRGTVTLVGQGPSWMTSFGDYAVDGAKFQPLTLLQATATFGAPDKSP